jgi:hypothetical protein
MAVSGNGNLVCLLHGVQVKSGIHDIVFTLKKARGVILFP